MKISKILSIVMLPVLVLMMLGAATGPVSATGDGTGEPFNLSASASATTNSTFVWTIEKVGDASTLELSPGQTMTVNYSVTLTATKQVEGTSAVTGAFSISKQIGEPVQIDQITATIDGDPVDFSCASAGGRTDVITLPHTIPAGGWSIPCKIADSSVALTAGVLTVVVTPNPASGLSPFSITENVAVTPGSTTLECVNVTDTLGGNLGEVCAKDSPKTFTYSYKVGAYAACGQYMVDNTATITETGQSDSWNVDITVPCAGGCSLTPGYWKTHSSYGPAPYDSTWAIVGENTAFYSSGASYYQVLWTAPQGNVYYILAHAYIAAYLNNLNGADTSVISAELAQAVTFFQTYTPAQAAALTKQQRNVYIALAEKLDSYNNGVIGPGHCSE